jgi:hypothetical protein
LFGRKAKFILNIKRISPEAGAMTFTTRKKRPVNAKCYKIEVGAGTEKHMKIPVSMCTNGTMEASDN